MAVYNHLKQEKLDNTHTRSWIEKLCKNQLVHIANQNVCWTDIYRGISQEFPVFAERSASRKWKFQPEERKGD